MVDCGGREMVSGDTMLADLANGFANNGPGQLRMQLDQAVVCCPCEQACAATTD